MVPDTPDVKSVAAKIEAVANGDQLIIDISTIAPMAERAIAARMRAKGAEYLDAPVSGGETGPLVGTLTIMAASVNQPQFLTASEAVASNIEVIILKPGSVKAFRVMISVARRRSEMPSKSSDTKT
jgi:2-hydroxy-3-oxopropionate reductase